jgi:hypothetical protein
MELAAKAGHEVWLRLKSRPVAASTRRVGVANRLRKPEKCRSGPTWVERAVGLQPHGPVAGLRSIFRDGVGLLRTARAANTPNRRCTRMRTNALDLGELMRQVALLSL